MLPPKVTWFVPAMVAAITWSSPAIAYCQELGRAPLVDAAERGWPLALSQDVTRLPIPTSVDRVMADTADVSAQVPADWQAWKAEVDAKLNEIAAKESAAKEQAAGRPSVKVGGRIMVDWAAFSQNADSKAQAGDFQNGTEFRRARIFLAGDAFDIIDYKLQFEFADDETVRNSSDTDTTLIDQIAFKDVSKEESTVPRPPMHKATALACFIRVYPCNPWFLLGSCPQSEYDEERPSRSRRFHGSGDQTICLGTQRPPAELVAYGGSEHCHGPGRTCYTTEESWLISTSN
jgi:hypothetical protein